MFETIVCVTVQTREMLYHVLTIFEVAPDYNLNIMKPERNFNDVMAHDLIVGEVGMLLEDKAYFDKMSHAVN